MKVLLYINPDKDPNGAYYAEISSVLKKHGINFDRFNDGDNVQNRNYNAMIVIGGDGTILRRTEIANLCNIPIIGINCGRLGFLSEFEICETEEAIRLLKNGELVPDERLTLKIVYKDKTYFALNDVVLSRIYEENKRMVINVGLKIGNACIQPVIGDGIIVSTPTGSTAYSLSAGGAILEPHINAFCITPIAAHSFSSRSIVFQAGDPCLITHEGGANAGLFVDGKLVDELHENDFLSVFNAERKTVFLRKRGFDFFARLNDKMSDR